MEAIFRIFLSFFVIFTIAAIAGMLSERAGVINMGIEGFMTIGALGYAITAFIARKMFDSNQLEMMKVLILILGLIISMVVAGLFSLLHSLMIIKLKTDQVVSGTVINLLAQGISLFIVHVNGLSNGGIIKSQISISLISTTAFTIYGVFTVIITVVMGLYFTFTKVGTRHIAAGENPQALDAAGIRVNKYRIICITLSSALAGLSGAMFVSTRSLQNYNGTVQGLGFIALAIMIIGQWRSNMILFFSCIFSIMFSVGQNLNILGTLPKSFPFIMSLFVMIIASRWSSPPQASGIPFDKTLR